MCSSQDLCSHVVRLQSLTSKAVMAVRRSDTESPLVATRLRGSMCFTETQTALVRRERKSDLMIMEKNVLTNMGYFFTLQVDKFTIEAVDLGLVFKVKIRHDNSMMGADWYLDQVEVVDMETDEVYMFLCERWLSKKKEDRRIERTFYVKVTGTQESASFIVCTGTQRVGIGYSMLKQYSTSASGVGKGYSHGWCSAVATRPEAEWRNHCFSTTTK